MKTHIFTCSQCKKKIKHKSDITTGYGTDPKTNKKVCFKCCGENDARNLKNMAIGDKTYLYLDTKEKTLSNWPGTLKIAVCNVTLGRHNIAGNRYDVWFVYGDNCYWGVQYGDFTQICHIKRVKKW